ncbi:hypothetical protein KUTeg_009334 [Tegillarca granosa]|uniref:Proline dehydrogenase n=1 Tax=Tegillarca granosa TaxID=220873 RepID=A0ABQ9F3I4_TEGGR|nr:hypothetical protein KUTeg_009334 [Tegillarca granosa]
MEELGLQPSNGSVFFGQVYGMCDHISYTLGQNGYLIYKSIPYGTVADTLPYLSRRALENRSVMDFRRERKLLLDAFRDRMSISSTGKT